MLAALPPLVPSLPAAGQKARAAPLVGSADALALAQLAAECARREAPARRRRADALAAQRLADELPWFAPGLDVALLPDWETLPYDHFSPHQDLVSQRLATLYHVSRGECDVLVVAATTALYRLAPPDYLAAFTFFLKQGTRLDVDALRAQLALAGYQHVTQVVSPGEFSVRGGLIDLFPMGSPLPYRARPLRRRHRDHQDVRRRHAAHALSGSRRAAPAGARVSARRSRAARAFAAAIARCSKAIRRARRSTRT